MSDEELIERLAGGHPQKEAAARQLLGAPDHFRGPDEGSQAVTGVSDSADVGFDAIVTPNRGHSVHTGGDDG